MRYLSWLARFALQPKQNDEWYRSLFSPRKRHLAVGEITPGYAILPESGIEHVKRFAPQAKLIYIMRDPVSRALSNRRMALEKIQNRGREFSKEDWFGDLMTRPTEQDHSRYDLIVPKWEKHFKSKILFLFHDNIGDGEECLKNICSHLGVNFDNQYFPKRGARIAPTKAIEIPGEVREAYARHYRGTIEWAAKRFGMPAERWLVENEALLADAK